MDWGILQGLGQGLQQWGGMKMEQDAEKRRTMLAEKLQQDREERAKLAFDPQQSTIEEGEGGAWFQIKRNKNGDVIGRDLAPKSEIDRIQRETKKENLSIDSLSSQIEANKVNIAAKNQDMAWEKEDRALMTPAERAAAMKTKAGLLPSADTKYSTDGSIQKAMLSASTKAGTAVEDEPTMAEYAKSYLENNPEVTAEFVDSKKLTANQAQAAVMEVLKAFSQRGIKPTEADFKAHLEKYAKAKGAKEKTSGGIQLSLKGNNG